MKASQLTLAVLLTAAFGSAAHAANVEGGSSNPNLINPKISDTIPFGWGAAGIQVSSNGHFSNSINLEVGPAQRIRNKYGNTPINGGNQNANVNGAGQSEIPHPR